MKAKDTAANNSGSAPRFLLFNQPQDRSTGSTQIFLAEEIAEFMWDHFERFFLSDQFNYDQLGEHGYFHPHPECIELDDIENFFSLDLDKECDLARARSIMRMIDQVPYDHWTCYRTS